MPLPQMTQFAEEMNLIWAPVNPTEIPNPWAWECSQSVWVAHLFFLSITFVWWAPAKHNLSSSSRLCETDFEFVLTHQ
jgi:hypothetical protein